MRAEVACNHWLQICERRLAGTFTPTPELVELAKQAGKLTEAVHRKAQRNQALPRDVSPGDVVLLLEMLSSITLPGADGGHALRRRYLALFLQALRAPAAGALPGRAAGPDQVGAQWRVRASRTTSMIMTGRSGVPNGRRRCALVPLLQIRILLITGPAGVGKSTLGWEISAQLRQGTCCPSGVKV